MTGQTPRRSRPVLAVLVLATTFPALAACGGQARLPAPRPIIVHSGVRVQPERARLDSIRGWYQRELQNIEEDPAFLIASEARDSAPLPWATLEIVGDTARVGVPETVPDAIRPYLIYAHLRLMVEMERGGSWLPEEVLGDRWETERAIVERTADAWLFQRSILDGAPYAPLDELLYAREFGYLEAFLLTAREDEFPREREAWLEEEPGRLDDYRAWFVETFSREPPGMREEGGG